jgi:hypothetical protein
MPKLRLPQTGWRLTDRFDLGRLDPLIVIAETCCVCKRTLRYIDILEHPRVAYPIIAGRTCSKRLRRPAER